MAPTLSKVWNSFSKKDKEVAICQYCSKEVKYCGNTSNLHKHLKNHNLQTTQTNSEKSGMIMKPMKQSYPIKKRELLAKNIELIGPSTSSNKYDHNFVTSLEVETTIRKAYERLSSFRDGNEHVRITSCILYFICKDMMPFNVVEGSGFKKLLKEIAPFYKVPRDKYFEEQLCLKYDRVKNKVVEKLSKVNDVCLTMNTWTESMSDRSFLEITIHFLDKTNTVSCNLATRELISNHTEEYVSTLTKVILQEWNVAISKIRCIVTVNDANMICAAKNVAGEECHLPCFAYTINLVVELSLEMKEIKEIIDKVRTIVIWIKNNVRNSGKLRKQQLDNGVPEGSIKKLLLDNKTQWNSVFYMLERFVEMIKICSELLLDTNNGPEMLSGHEIEIIKQIVSLLRPFEFSIREASIEQYVSLSKEIPIISCLTSQIKSYCTRIDSVKQLQQCLINELKQRFGSIESNTHAAFATVLDPRFKNLYFQNITACTKALHKIREIVQKDFLNSESEEELTLPTYDFWQHHRQLILCQTIKRENHDSDELTQYLAAPLASLKSNPLEEWEEIKSLFPNLYRLARLYLVTVATSVPCERLFSKAGSIMTQKRNRLLGKYLDKLFFISGLSEEEFFD